MFSADTILVSGDSFPSTADAFFLVEAFLDLDSNTGIHLAAQFLAALGSFPSTVQSSSEEATSIGLVYRILSSTKSAPESSLCPLLASAHLLGSSKVQELVGFALQHVDSVSVEKLLAEAAVSDEIRQQMLSNIEENNPWFNHPYLNEETLSVENAIVANGRVYEIDGASIDVGDIDLLLSVEMERSKAVTRLLRKHITLTSPSDTKVVSDVTTILAVQENEGNLERV